jgi:hypothetical protein
MKIKNMKSVRVHKDGGGPKDLVYEENIMRPPHPKEGEFRLESMLQELHQMRSFGPVVDTILPLSQASKAYEGAKDIYKHSKIVLRVRTELE